MKVNQKVRYAVACLFELAKTTFEFRDADDIAAAQKVPAAFAHKILQVLTRAGFLFSQKGLGYKLARPLADITALELMEALATDWENNQTTPDVSLAFEKKLNAVLGGVSVGELVGSR